MPVFTTHLAAPHRSHTRCSTALPGTWRCSSARTHHQDQPHGHLQPGSHSTAQHSTTERSHMRRRKHGTLCRAALLRHSWLHGLHVQQQYSPLTVTHCVLLYKMRRTLGATRHKKKAVDTFTRAAAAVGTEYATQSHLCAVPLLLR
jgi:hypothetical protein